jgi:hypothetical protein
MQVRCHNGEAGKCQVNDALAGPCIFWLKLKWLNYLTKSGEPFRASWMCAR